MAVTLKELATSRRFTADLRRPTGSVAYIAYGSDDVGDVEAAAELALPATFPDFAALVIQNIDCDPQGGGVWMITAGYALPEWTDLAGQGGVSPPPPPPPAPGATDALGGEYSFDTTGGSVKVYQSLATIDSRAAGDAEAGPSTAQDYKQAIGVTKDGVDGVDVYAPKLTFSMTRNVASISLDYIKTLRDLTGCINDDTFYTFDAFEVLFLGAQGQFQKDGWRITYQFAISKTQTSIVISPDITLPLKYGWDYVWVAYRDSVDAGRLVKVPDAAYVEEVYPNADFSLLGVG